MAKQCLLVIDMQNDFCLPGAVLCVEGAMGCCPKVIEAVSVARQNNVPVVWVVRHHDASGIDVDLPRVPLFKDGKSGYCVTGTKGAELVEGLVVEKQDILLVKKRFSAFFGTNLDLILKRLQVEQVVIAGVQTPNCIRGTAWDSLQMDYATLVLEDATASRTPEIQAANLKDMANAGIKISNVADWKTSLEDVYE